MLSNASEKNDRDVGAVVRRTKIGYIIWWVAMPVLVAALSFGALCALECTALPWYTFVVAPLAVTVLAAAAAIVYWMWSASLPDEHKRSVRWLVGSSVLWGPVAAAAGGAVLVMAAQVAAALF
jgi:hypothetical protein